MRTAAMHLRIRFRIYICLTNQFHFTARFRIRVTRKTYIRCIGLIILSSSSKVYYNLIIHNVHDFFLHQLVHIPNKKASLLINQKYQSFKFFLIRNIGFLQPYFYVNKLSHFFEYTSYTKCAGKKTHINVYLFTTLNYEIIF